VKTKKGSRKRVSKVQGAPVSLTEEQQQQRDQCDLLLRDFDKQVESLKVEAARECKAAQDSITTTYKLELMKMPKQVKEMSWDDYCAQHNITGGLPLSNAVASVLEDSVLESVDSTVSNIKSAMKNKRKEKENRTPSMNKKKPTRKGTTGSKGAASLVTPKNPPPRQAKTPMITPKFDTGRVMRSVSRAAKAGEVLVSLSGSPVAPTVQMRSKAAKEVLSQAQIPLGNGNVLNLPVEMDGTDVIENYEFGADQRAKLELLHKNLGNMLKIKAQVTEEEEEG